MSPPQLLSTCAAPPPLQLQCPLTGKPCARRLPPPSRPLQYHAWHFALSGVSLLVAAIISLARPTYLRHRTAILVAAKLACFLSLGTALQPHVALLPRVMQLDGPPPSTALLRFALILEQVGPAGGAAGGAVRSCTL